MGVLRNSVEGKEEGAEQNHDAAPRHPTSISCKKTRQTIHKILQRTPFFKKKKSSENSHGERCVDQYSLSGLADTTIARSKNVRMS